MTSNDQVHEKSFLLKHLKALRRFHRYHTYDLTLFVNMVVVVIHNRQHLPSNGNGASMIQLIFHDCCFTVDYIII